MEARIDPRAVVEKEAEIGEDTSIWHFSHVRSGSIIGRNCIIGKGAYIDTGVIIGDRCKIQNGAMIYKGVRIESDVFVGPHAVFTNDLHPRANIWSEERLVGTNVLRGSSIGANATIRCGVTLGRWSMIGAGSVVTKDVPDHGIILGVPGKLSGWACKCGVPIDCEITPKPTEEELVCHSCK